MKSYFKILFPSILIFVFSCAEINSNIARKTVVQPQFTKINLPERNELLYIDHLKPLNSNTETFLINNSSDTTLFGKNGTKITIPSNCLCNQKGIPVEGMVQIELKELFNKSDLLLNNKPTVADRKMLVTGGAIYLNAKSGKENLMISCPDGISVSVPKNSDYPGMELFLGQINKRGNINWVKDSSLTPVNMGNEPIEGGEGYYNEIALTYEEKQIMDASGEMVWISSGNSNNSYVFSTNKFGWINCDAFYEDPREKVNMIVKIPNGVPEDYSTNMYFVFKNMKSVMPLYSGDKENFLSTEIPLGEEIYIVAISGKDNKFYMDIKESTVRKGVPEILSMKEFTKEEIKKRIEELN